MSIVLSYSPSSDQGILAGINAALCSRGERALTIDRGEAYIGVLVDDLTNNGTTEPYRMFTRLAEHAVTIIKTLT